MPGERRIEPARVVGDRIAERLRERLLARPERGHEPIVVEAVSQQVELGRRADRLREGAIGRLHALDVDAQRLVVPGDQRERRPVGPRDVWRS